MITIGSEFSWGHRVHRDMEDRGRAGGVSYMKREVFNVVNGKLGLGATSNQRHPFSSLW